MLPKILVLEDTYERVQWLRASVRGRARVVWARGVTSFRKLYTRFQDGTRLIILDHDLGLSRADALEFNSVTGLYTHHHDPCNDGPKGLSGADAASWLATFGWEIPCPVWIWSWNPGAAKDMLVTLAKGGVKVAVRQPFEGGRRDAEIVNASLREFSDA